MRAGQTVIVCGADFDRAQFEPFEWPDRALVRVGVGCGLLDSLEPGPEDASAETRDEIARAYVRLACDASTTDLERAARGVSSWLRLVERAAKVPCAMVVARGGVRVSAVPLFSAVWTRDTVRISGASFSATKKRREGDEVGSPVIPRRVLAESGISVDDYKVVQSGTAVRGSVYFIPRERCALCDAPIRSMFSAVVRAYERCAPSHSPQGPWIRIRVCAACPVRSFRLWRMDFTVASEAEASEAEASENTNTLATLFDEGAHESAWQAGGRVVVTLALALTSKRAGPCNSTFAAALATALCDMKLLRVVADRFVFPAPSARSARRAPRALGVLIESALTKN
jgi:hypothetical protein